MIVCESYSKLEAWLPLSRFFSIFVFFLFLFLNIITLFLGLSETEKDGKMSAEKVFFEVKSSIDSIEEGKGTKLKICNFISSASAKIVTDIDSLSKLPFDVCLVQTKGIGDIPLFLEKGSKFEKGNWLNVMVFEMEQNQLAGEMMNDYAKFACQLK